MSSKTRRQSTKTSKKSQLNLKTRPKINKWLSVAIVAVVASIGAYFLFFASAATPTECRAVSGGSICDQNEISNGDDALVSSYSETKNISWGMDYGIALSAPNFRMSGAKPVYRFFRPDWSAHGLFIEGSADYNTAMADPAHYTNEGISFYAWDKDGAHPQDTVPIYRVGRGLYLLNLYFDNHTMVNNLVNLPDHSYQDLGVAFYAFPARYTPPPATPVTTTKDSNCANAGLKQYDKGACVQQLKTNLKKFGSNVNVDPNNNELDSNSLQFVAVFVNLLQQAGQPVDNFGSVITPSIWNAMAGGPVKTDKPLVAPDGSTTQPAAPVVLATDCTKLKGGAKTTCQAAQNKATTTLQTKTPIGSAVSSGSGSSSGSVAKKESTYCPLLLVEFINSNGKAQGGLPLSKECISSWQRTIHMPADKQDGLWGTETKKAGFYTALALKGADLTAKTTVADPAGSAGVGNHSWTILVKHTKSDTDVQLAITGAGHITSNWDRLDYAFCSVNIHNAKGDNQLYWDFPKNACIAKYELGCFLNLGCDPFTVNAQAKWLYSSITSVNSDVYGYYTKTIKVNGGDGLKAPVPTSHAASFF